MPHICLSFVWCHHLIESHWSLSVCHLLCCMSCLLSSSSVSVISRRLFCLNSLVLFSVPVMKEFADRSEACGRTGIFGSLTCNLGSWGLECVCFISCFWFNWRISVVLQHKAGGLRAHYWILTHMIHRMNEQAGCVQCRESAASLIFFLLNVWLY